MLLKTERLLIWPVAAEDWPAFQEIWTSFGASPYAQYDMPHATDEESVRARICRWANAQGLAHMFFAVCLGDTVIGYIACNQREDSHEIGYCFHCAYHGKGYAKESFQALFSHLQALGIKWLTARTAINNIPSVALLQSLGFALTEYEKVSFYKDQDGKDIVFDGGIYALNI